MSNTQYKIRNIQYPIHIYVLWRGRILNTREDGVRSQRRRLISVCNLRFPQRYGGDRPGRSSTAGLVVHMRTVLATPPAPSARGPLAFRVEHFLSCILFVFCLFSRPLHHARDSMQVARSTRSCVDVFARRMPQGKKQRQQIQEHS